MNIPLTKELRMDMARFEIPVSGWTCFRTKQDALVRFEQWMSDQAKFRANRPRWLKRCCYCKVDATTRKTNEGIIPL